MEKQYKIEETKLIGIEGTWGHSKLTKKAVVQFIKDEIKRLFNNPKNINYRLMSSKEQVLHITRKQFMEIVNDQSQNQDDGFLHAGYDDNNSGTYIGLIRDIEGKKKTTITIEI